MAIFGFQTLKSEIVDKFVADTNNRLNSDNFIKNPFKGKIVNLGCENYGAILEPAYPPLYWIGLPLAIVGFSFSGYNIYWAIPGFLILSLGFFYSATFFYIMLKMGLRKAGYKFRIIRISTDKIIGMSLLAIK